jgi:hypothetical protein
MFSLHHRSVIAALLVSVFYVASVGVGSATFFYMSEGISDMGGPGEAMKVARWGR